MSEPQVPEGVASELALENEHHVQGAEQGPPEQGPRSRVPRGRPSARTAGERGVSPQLSSCVGPGRGRRGAGRQSRRPRLRVVCSCSRPCARREVAGNETGGALSRQQGKAEATSRVSPQGDSGGAPSRRGLAGGRIGKYRWHFRPREDEKILSTEATRGATLCSGPRWEREVCHEALLNGGTFQKGLAPAQPDDPFEGASPPPAKGRFAPGQTENKAAEQ